jgi:hypothetical protein
MEKLVELEPSTLEKIIDRTLVRLEKTGIFTQEEIHLLRDAAAAGCLSKPKVIQAILERRTGGVAE